MAMSFGAGDAIAVINTLISTYKRVKDAPALLKSLSLPLEDLKDNLLLLDEAEDEIVLPSAQIRARFQRYRDAIIQTVREVEKLTKENIDIADKKLTFKRLALDPAQVQRLLAAMTAQAQMLFQLRYDVHMDYRFNALGFHAIGEAFADQAHKPDLCDFAPVPQLLTRKPNFKNHFDAQETRLEAHDLGYIFRNPESYVTKADILLRVGRRFHSGLALTEASSISHSIDSAEKVATSLTDWQPLLKASAGSLKTEGTSSETEISATGSEADSMWEILPRDLSTDLETWYMAS